MTALSPVEAAEVSRFGIHDADVLAGMVEHADDRLQCDRAACDAPAELRLIRLCCARMFFACGPHFHRHQHQVEVELAKPRPHRCRWCGFRFPSDATFSEIYRVVPL